MCEILPETRNTDNNVYAVDPKQFIFDACNNSSGEELQKCIKALLVMNALQMTENILKMFCDLIFLIMFPVFKTIVVSLHNFCHDFAVFL